MRDETAGEIARMLLTLRSDDAGRIVLAEQRPKSMRMNAGGYRRRPIKRTGTDRGEKRRSPLKIDA
jgi:hypothetical protein